MFLPVPCSAFSEPSYLSATSDLDIIHIEDFRLAFHFGFAAKRLIEDEVVVPLQRMSVYTGILVAVTGYELLQFGGCFG